MSVKFKDRAILNMSKDASSVHILMPDGSTVKSTVPANGPCESYVRSALEFRRWAVPVGQGWAPYGPVQVYDPMSVVRAPLTILSPCATTQASSSDDLSAMIYLSGALERQRSG